ncbi:Glycosyl hydrolase family 71 [Mucilaginibacter mallensis]|uniref:Glycosyl hydrolase family 71 n=1 Tax=Mucilaginibacter mallensis TaxID=652787 RepID=A0A1H1ZD59_MUCMA|nr:endo-1,3-alpha-glucanase family glycosylhydrolase [Mucilaginibacter mallensis]SDT31442.1 Glycosyl hydrolase family 71 [Mucilaginibacter mallensis]
MQFKHSGRYTKCSQLLLLLLFFINCSVHAQDSLKNLPEYSLPLTGEKLVIAHCMTNIIRYKDHPYEDSGNPDFYDKTGNITAPLGGLTQVKPMANDLMANATLDESVEFEMRAAIRSGIDGFQFYYVLGLPDWDNIIKAYFRVAEAKHLNFKFTVCISHPNGGTEALKVAEYARRINGIMDEVGHNNPHWLRTPDGRLVVYQWLGDGLADIPADKQGLPDQFYIARAYKRLADDVHERFACVYTINTMINKQKLDDILDYFPAVWIWTLPYSNDYLGNMVADECKARNRNFTGSVFSDFYTSKLLKKGTWDMYHTANEAADAGISNVERKYIITGLSYNFRKLFEFGIKQNVPIINVITWNDYPEGHHLAPEINHNDGFSILLNYYKSVWKDLPSPYSDRDVAVVFFKKYKHNITPKPYNIPVKSFQREVIPTVWEDSIEVVTLLKAKGRLNVNGQYKEVAAGLVSTKFKMSDGPVNVSVSRNDIVTVHFTTPEGITSHPYRADRLTYSFSSEFNRFYKDLYPGFTPEYSHEYNPGFVKSDQNN